VDRVEYWKVADLTLGIVITCCGHDKEGTVQKAVLAFDQAVAKREGSFTIIADLQEMTGYETESRQAWQTAFARCRRRVDGLVLVGAKSALIRMGAAAVGAFAGIPVRFVGSWAEVPGAQRT
jgi:hypothetical protein